METVVLKWESEMTEYELRAREISLLVEREEAQTDEVYYFVKAELQEVWKEMKKRGIEGA